MGEPTPTIGWRKNEDGMIVTWDLPNGAECAPMPAEAQHAAMDAVEARWGALCRESGERHQLPDGWLQAMIWRESLGNPKAFRQERHKDGTPIVSPNGRPLTGVGLMQITSPALKGQRTDAELMSPALNIEIGAKYLAEIAARPDVKGDFARASATFNAGSVQPSKDNPWGMRSTGNHVQAEVCAYNYFVSLKLADEQRTAALAVAVQFDLRDTLESNAVSPATETEA